MESIYAPIFTGIHHKGECRKGNRNVSVVNNYEKGPKMELLVKNTNEPVSYSRGNSVRVNLKNL